MLNLQQEDALKEYMNMFIGQASSLLSEIVDKKIILTLPQIMLLNLEQPEDLLRYSEVRPTLFNSHVVSSIIEFGKRFSGNARLLFPKDKAQVLAHLCLGEDYEAVDDGELTDVDFDVIREIGNVILNSVLGGIGNLLDLKLEYTFPKVQVCFFPEEEEAILFNKETHVMVICNTFSFEDTQLDGAIVMVFNMSSTIELIKKIDEVLVDIDG
ncbi:chemotaxis protein CheC [Acetobacterium paludosum]|uniref:Chemotaxis protein CheC n=1 Tax=Acetobacterium paludosum TaxID=52693 RepID=A0A923KWW1_9FIRM|nr:chemotaxis protein CheC [Acetobacterium paludosum]MBC3888845.1 chemotaxis protein CheC [Acetobacterium paludosum]